MDGPMNVKFVGAKQAKETYHYRNIKGKLYNYCASSWFYYRNNITMHGPTNVKFDFLDGLSLSPQ